MKFLVTLATAFFGLTLAAPGVPTRGHPPHESLTKRQDLKEGQLTFYPASEPNGIGILVVPGGGYAMVSLDYEGANTTAYLNARGYDAWVLDYSTAATAPVPLYPKPQHEALAAVKQIRAENRVTKLGIWGYSAGGHLSAMTLTEPGVALDFGILAYPVITMDPTFTHLGSRDNLIGPNATLALQDETSAEKRVTAGTPRTFIFHTADDPTVPVQNTLAFVNSLAANKVPFQSLVIPDGPHGIALALSDPVRNWTPELERWMKYSI